MRVITLNVNGLRSAHARGFYRWLARQQADVVCLQEIRIHDDELAKPAFRPRGWHAHFAPAERRGYSGVAIYSRTAPQRLVRGLGLAEFDPEGRYLQADFGNLSIASLYLPSGSSSAERQAAKFRFLDQYRDILLKQRGSRRQFILCGDWNIAHRAIDLRNWRANQKNSGFLPEERAWLDWLFGDAGYVDVFRRIDARPGQYTWWSNRGQAWANNVGWRIDYQVATPGIAGSARAASIYRARRFSDHAPLIIDYDHAL